MATKHRTGCLIRRGKNFYVRWVVEGKVFSKALRDGNGSAITTKREAEEAKQKLMAPFVVADEAAALESIAGKLEGRKAELAKLEDQQNPPLRIGEAWAAFLASPNRPDSGEETLYQYKCQWSAFSDWMKEKHADAPALRDVTKEIAEDYAASLNGGRLSPNTYNKHLNLLTLVFRVLKHKAKLTSNHWEDIQRKRITTQSRRELTVDELKTVCRDATGELRPLLALGIYSGLRLGDCATLRWGEVDLQRGIIRRIPNKTARRNPKPVIVPIHPVLRDMLAATPTDMRGDYVLPETAALYNRRTDLVTDMVQGHFASCGLKPHKPGTGKDGKRAVVEVGFHSLRHTFISLCRASDVPLSVVESLVGHSTPAMTKHYTHTGELAAGRAVAALPFVIGEQKHQRNGEENVLLKIRRVVKSITAANWKQKKAGLLALLTDKVVQSPFVAE
jgi:integrase